MAKVVLAGGCGAVVVVGLAQAAAGLFFGQVEVRGTTSPHVLFAQHVEMAKQVVRCVHHVGIVVPCALPVHREVIVVRREVTGQQGVQQCTQGVQKGHVVPRGHGFCWSRVLPYAVLAFLQ